MYSGNLSRVDRVLFSDGITNPRFGNHHILQRFISEHDPQFKKILEGHSADISDLAMCLHSVKFKGSKFFTRMMRFVKLTANQMGLPEEDALRLRGWVFLKAKDVKALGGQRVTTRYQLFKDAFRVLKHCGDDYLRGRHPFVYHNYKNVILSLKKKLIE